MSQDQGIFWTVRLYRKCKNWDGPGQTGVVGALEKLLLPMSEVGWGSLRDP